ncbi:hypothetical protein COCCADRAFT_39557 [Bipolaris zeicola 26-R-13]|uniref:Uncharacterized protein n=1 Tax=Cochliobolus carbonum (strain 26-R-13) TaxID=930089 RepID=W6XRS1_COCC2|nr:uncharacterized protein COCCADRAFT_39557 [Bipolaris zeicola 26-R-13]EUC30157.1 hypothetical protein COCCADRAFT_39557 [Bipolaris zeicola 26-R-13]
MPRKRSYFDGPGRILGTGELVEPKCSVKKMQDAGYIPPKDIKSDTEDGSYADDVQDRTKDEEWTPKSKKRNMKQGKAEGDEVCLLEELNKNDAAVTEGQDGGGRHECSCSVCKKLRGEEED